MSEQKTRQKNVRQKNEEQKTRQKNVRQKNEEQKTRQKNVRQKNEEQVWKLFIFLSHIFLSGLPSSLKVSIYENAS
jgi:hypothetical protein